MKSSGLVVVVASMFVLTACASTAPSATTATYFSIYSVPGGTARLSQVEDAVVASANAVTGASNVANFPPPNPLPASAGRFQLINVGSGSTMIDAADPESSGEYTYYLTNARCAGSPFTVNGQEVDNPAIKIKTVYCVYAYRQGIQVDVVLITSQTSGTSGGATGYLLHLTRSLFNSEGVGWQQRIDQEFSDIQQRLAKLDGRVAVVDSYLPKPSAPATSN